jgi:hypothetical protein
MGERAYYMQLDKLNIQQLIEDIKDLPNRKPCLPEIDYSLVDAYDLRFIGKKEARKLTHGELEALLRYAQSYSEQFKSGKFMYQAGLADFDEADTHHSIQNCIAILQLELKRRTGCL